MLELHENMLHDAENSKEAEAEKQELLEFFYKYAEQAEILLSNDSEDYTEDDVIKLASYLIDQDIDGNEQVDKVAELDESGRIMARAFVDELSKNTDVQE
jgi:hypothetical protein